MKQFFAKHPLVLKALKFLLVGFVASFTLAFIADDALAQQFSMDLGEEGNLSGRVVQLILLMTVLSLAPSILVTVTSFTRIVVVLSILRTALGTQQTPPNIVITSLALFLTGYVMSPVLETAYETGLSPLINEEITEEQAFDNVVIPFKQFMLANARDEDVILFLDMRAGPAPATAMDTPLTVLIPAFMISELKRAFEIGFLLYVPFLVLDGVIAAPVAVNSKPFSSAGVCARLLLARFRGLSPIMS